MSCPSDVHYVIFIPVFSSTCVYFCTLLLLLITMSSVNIIVHGDSYSSTFLQLHCLTHQLYSSVVATVLHVSLVLQNRHHENFSSISKASFHLIANQMVILSRPTVLPLFKKKSQKLYTLAMLYRLFKSVLLLCNGLLG